MNEIWDAYDKNFQIIANIELVRGEPLPDGMYHLVSEITVRHTDGTYLLMQRDFRKHFGGMWELTAGGSALQGESPLDCAIRELKEETGISATELKEIGKNVHDGHHTLYVEYLCVTNQDKGAVILQDGETVGYQWVDKSTLFAMSEKELASTRSFALIKALDI